jgi:hypothetical protein
MATPMVRGPVACEFALAQFVPMLAVTSNQYVPAASDPLVQEVEVTPAATME